MDPSLAADGRQSYCPMCNGPCKYINYSNGDALLPSPEKEEPKALPAIRRSVRVKKISQKKKTNRFCRRMAVMKRIPSVRLGPVTDFIDKEDYSAMKMAQKSSKGSEQLISQKKSTPALIPASNGSTPKNSRVEWDFVPQRMAALKKVSSVQNGPLTDFKPKTTPLNQTALRDPMQKNTRYVELNQVPQRMAALKKVASVQSGPLTDFKPKIQKKVTFTFNKKTIAMSIVKKAPQRIAETNKPNSQLGSSNLSSFKARLSNPGLIVIDDKSGNRLFVHDSLNMFRDSIELLSRQPGTLGAALGPFVYPATVRANAVFSYIPSGSFEKTVKAKPSLCSSWTELGSYFRNIRV